MSKTPDVPAGCQSGNETTFIFSEADVRESDDNRASRPSGW